MVLELLGAMNGIRKGISVEKIVLKNPYLTPLKDSRGQTHAVDSISIYRNLYNKCLVSGY